MLLGRCFEEVIAELANWNEQRKDSTMDRLL